MNSKIYVSLKTARLLKEKGYNKETIFYYNYAGKLYLGVGHFNHNIYDITLSAPTKAEAIDWLESKGIVIWVEPTIDGWLYFMKSEQHYEDNAEPIFGTFKTRLKAEEAAIIKALEML